MQSGEVNIQKIDSEWQLADIMTKALGEVPFKRLRDALMGWEDASLVREGVSQIKRENEPKGIRVTYQGRVQSLVDDRC